MPMGKPGFDAVFARRGMSMFIFAVLLLLASPLHAADAPAAAAAPDPASERNNVDVDKECQRVKDLQPPRADLPEPKLRAELARCNAADLYYGTQSEGTSTQADWNKVRACAFTTQDKNILMMLYINGLGVRFNADLAIKYACEGGGMGGEINSLVSDMLEIKETGEPPLEPYNSCKYAFNTLAINYCAGWAEKREDKKRKRTLDGLGHRLNAPQQAAFEKLRQAAETFATAIGADEYTAIYPGSAGIASEISARMDENSWFLNCIEQTEKGELPTYTQKHYSALDTQLNQAYRDRLQAVDVNQGQDKTQYGISQEDIRKTQRLWLKYRDAWAEYGRVRFPKVPAHAWKAMLTERRIKQLQGDEN